MGISVLKNFGFLRKCGILMPVSSLPSKYGIGSFGAPAHDFVDFLCQSGQTCWQVLPLNPTAYGDSPYQSPSSFAGNPYFIDLDILKEQGLLCDEDLLCAIHDTKDVDYGWLFATRYDILRKAFLRFAPNQDYNQFVLQESGWLDDYALFMALKEKYCHRAWIEWESQDRDYSLAKGRADELKTQCDFWRFVQYMFFSQWHNLCAYAKQKGVQIIGDMPIYVAYDSVEVWANPSEFLLDENLRPRLVAGCPPDGFAPDGQLWGNPIYNWSKMQKEGFKWWIERIKHGLQMYNILRIDHFRGFAGYYVIPFGEPTARNGHWVEGVGKDLFAKVFESVNSARIIAEDLGFITDDVRELLDFTGFPGMKILQFAFFDEDSEYLPANYKSSNCVVYTGTHDSDVTKEWCDNLSGDTKMRFLRDCPQVEQGDVYSMIMLALNSKANLAIIPLQDYLELGDEARMNRPAIASGNWVWRAQSDYGKVKERVLNCAKTAKRI